jgi:predicted transposase YdaD
MKTDSLFYRLLQAQPTLAFELAGLSVPEPSLYGFISQEIKQTAFRSWKAPTLGFG